MQFSCDWTLTFKLISSPCKSVQICKSVGGSNESSWCKVNQKKNTGEYFISRDQQTRNSQNKIWNHNFWTNIESSDPPSSATKTKTTTKRKISFRFRVAHGIIAGFECVCVCECVCLTYAMWFMRSFLAAHWNNSSKCYKSLELF